MSVCFAILLCCVIGAQEAKPVQIQPGGKIVIQGNMKVALPPTNRSDGIAPLVGSLPVPSRKANTAKYYDSWKAYYDQSQRVIADERTIRDQRTDAYWEQYQMGYRMLTDESNELLQLFMDGYRNDRHHFCAQYAEWMPRFDKNKTFAYAKDYYKHERPIMDELARLVLDSYNEQLVGQLRSLQAKDQQYRKFLSASQSKTERKRLLDEQRKIDIANLAVVRRVISEHGYPGRSLVGTDLERVVFLVIQHSGGDVIEEFLPLIKAAIDKGDLVSDVYPYLFDRLEVSRGRPQHFGTQSRLEGGLFPILDPKNVNARRSEYGLSPINYPD